MKDVGKEIIEKKVEADVDGKKNVDEKKNVDNGPRRSKRNTLK